MSRFDRIAPIFAYGVLGIGGIVLLLIDHPDASVYLTGAMVVMALRDRKH
jgi:hypothetical protein